MDLEPFAIPSSEVAQPSIQAEIEETNRAIKEVSLMLDNSKVELEKLTQRNTAINAHLQQVIKSGSPVSNEELIVAFESALDAQQRLFIMKGQLDKLQSDQTHLERYKSLANRLQSLSNPNLAGNSEASANANIEMVINAQEAERQRLSRQMHDGPAQALSNFILQTEIAMRLLNVDAEHAREELNSLKVSAMSTFQKVRNFIFELRPMMLDDLGLIPTIRQYAVIYKEQTAIDVNLNITGTERRLQSFLEVMVFRALQELLGNAARHGQASQVKVQFDIAETQVKLIVSDNGKGFDPGETMENARLGLNLIKERVESLGGSMNIDSAPGKGAKITLLIPAN